MNSATAVCYQNAGFAGSVVAISPLSESNASDSSGHLGGGDKSFRQRIQKHFTKKRLLSKLPFLQWIRHYTLLMLFSDFIAGITVGFTVIPQSIGYAAVAGLPLQHGLYSSFMAPLIYIFLGTVTELSVGPTAIMALMTYTYARKGGAEYAILLTFLTGFIELLAGLLNLGVLIEFISTPVITAFCSAAALTVASTQLRGLLGLKVKGSSFLTLWMEVINHIQETKPWDALLGFSAIFALLMMMKLNRLKNMSFLSKVNCLRNPLVDRTLWFLSTSRNAIAVIVGCVMAYLMEQSGNQPFTLTGDIKPGLPPFEFPHFRVNVTLEEGEKSLAFTDIVADIGTAIALVPLIAILEQVAIAKAFAAGKKTDANQEMIALGVGNVVGSFFGSMPITASFGRSSVQSSSGVRTPMANLFVGGMVLLALGFLMPSLAYIPKPILSAVIITSVIFLVEYHEIMPMWRSNRVELVPFFFTFFACLVNVEYGLLLGVALHLLLSVFLSGRYRPKMKTLEANNGVVVVAESSLYYPGVELFRCVLTKASQAASEGSPVIIDFHKMNSIDYTALKMLKSIAADLHKNKSTLKLINTNETIERSVTAILPSDHFVLEGSIRRKTESNSV